ncbi:uncharacterized protein DFL_001078 [Arthrobotrys flagrans]|uniref:Uncharacterized protein n=1 Tax=Arthrobotrys flagrans TaxID=97331 RepID=A0A437AG46_ARTFL|nr:hypothetical protein DFL_001078 [Arthrobotrys flagrans]
MDRVPNQEGMIPEDEVVPFAGQKRKREEQDDSPKKKRAINAWIAYRTYQNLFKPKHHQSEVSGKIKGMYATVSDDDKAKWCDVAREYTQGRDSFPGASRAWLSGMMATIVSRAGLAPQSIDMKPEIPVPPLVELPSKLCPTSLHTPQNVAESKKRARENGEPEFGRIPKKAKLIFEDKRKRLREAELEPVQEERSIKRLRVLKPFDYPSKDQDIGISFSSKPASTNCSPLSRETTPDSFVDTISEATSDNTLEPSLEISPKHSPERSPEPTFDMIPEPTLDMIPETTPATIPETTLDMILNTAPEIILNAAPEISVKTTPGPTPKSSQDSSPDTSLHIGSDTESDITAATPISILDLFTPPKTTPDNSPDISLDIGSEMIPKIILKTSSEIVIRSNPEIIVKTTPDLALKNSPENSPGTSLDVVSDTESDMTAAAPITALDLPTTPAIEKELASIALKDDSNDFDESVEYSEIFSSCEGNPESDTSYEIDTFPQNFDVLESKNILPESEDDHEPQNALKIFGDVSDLLPIPLPSLGDTSTQSIITSDPIGDIRDCFSSIEYLLARYQPGTAPDDEGSSSNRSEAYYDEDCSNDLSEACYYEDGSSDPPEAFCDEDGSIDLSEAYYEEDLSEVCNYKEKQD